MKKIFKNFVSYLQIPLLFFSYYFFFLFKNYISKVNFVIGTDEIAKQIYSIGKALDNSITVCLRKNRFYDYKYNFSININNNFLLFLYKIFYGPILLGYLANKTEIFFYVWSRGFLLNRNHDFKFLKSKNKKIVCVFLGDDIRSLILKLSYMKNLSLDTGESYYSNISDEKYDEEKKFLALSADTYANLIFSSPIDNMSYLKSKQFFWRLTSEKKFFDKNEKKFQISKIKILHAPTHPAFFKATPLVRYAIKKLQKEGYIFDYVELLNVKNQLILEHLKSTHIVLNQFYSFIPGVFGIEAMASNCAVLMSADPNIDTEKIEGGEKAWLHTRYWEIYDNLKYLLDNTEKIKIYADNGFEFAKKHHTTDALGEYISNILKKNNII
tara:strand:+ start:737 stop:1885 length:1149 start_codon:yes stop_codon:yes gene_type:complete